VRKADNLIRLSRQRGILNISNPTSLQIRGYSFNFTTIVNITNSMVKFRSRDRSAGTENSYGMGGWWSIPAGARDFYPLPRVETGSVFYAIPNPVGTGFLSWLMSSNELKLTTHIHLTSRSRKTELCFLSHL
jgi:hypothetical protein